MSASRRRFVITILLGAAMLLDAHAAGAQPDLLGSAVGPVIPTEHVRGVEQTFLTYPEWFLVFSSAEYAELVRSRTPDHFPFLRHVGQFWHSYQVVALESQARGNHLNPGYHLMVMVIGVSTTFEYALRSFYEHRVGRLTAAVARSEHTEEDRFGARYAQTYVAFIRELPWYEYDFTRELRTLWADVPWGGVHMLRKWERRWALTSELIVKALYGGLIKWGTSSIYETPLPVTAVAVEPLPELAPQLASMQWLATYPSGALITVPRYDGFTAAAQALAAQGGEFRSIAGNDSVILVSVVGRQDLVPVSGIDKLLLEQPILTQAGMKRVIAVAQVRQLASALRTWQRTGVQVEHIFDY